MASDTGRSAVLRAKYLDWYSARIAELFLRSSPEDIYALAHEGGEDESTEAATVRPADASRTEAYRARIARVTKELAARADLPDYNTWVRAYRLEPERYDREMFGFWRTELSRAGARDTGATTRR